MTRPPFTLRTQRYVRARALADMLDTIRIVRTGRGTLDETTLQMGMTSLSIVYEGEARIATASGGGVVMVADETLDTQNTNIYVPYQVVAQQDDVVLVLSDQSDTDNVSRAFRVMDVDNGGLLRMARTLTCTGYHGSRFWAP